MSRTFAADLKVTTQVLLSRDHTRWNFDAIMEAIQGPLLNPRRLEEALKASKFGRRLLAFFQPLNLRFSAIKRTKVRCVPLTFDEPEQCAI